MKKIEDFTPEQLVALSSTIGILISRKFNINERIVIAGFISGIAQSIVITVAKENYIEGLDINNQSGNNKNSNLNSGIEDLRKEIDELKKHIKHLEDNINF
jgi:peptidoglycan hydrolase CwlO-like protein